MTEATNDEPRYDALIVGAGLAGLYQLKTLRDLGLRVRVLEAADGVGGTWYWNVYPGARCDVESMSYSYSFCPELEQEWEWTEKYPTQPEILSYIQHVAERFDLLRDVRLGVRVTSAAYSEDTHRWTVSTDRGDVYDTQYLIMATGCLSVSKAPEIAGADLFSGPIHHTGHWPREGVDFTGKRLGVIGTGSSGIQSIPMLARQASELTVFQRTPNFSMPAGNRPRTPEEIAERKANYREWRAAQRASGFGIPVPAPAMSALEDTPENRQAKYQAGWDNGDLVSILSAYTDSMTNKQSNDTAAEFIRQKIRSIVHDPDTAKMLSPTDHAYGTKRPCLDSGYYATFNEPHVHLVDLRSTPLQEITANGIRTSEREYELDAIVFATGFDAMTGALTSIDIRGRGGMALKEKWIDGPRTYLGLALAGFPNLFTITGPASPSVLSNMVVSIEQHVEWITACIAHLRDVGKTEIEATQDAEDGWMTHSADVASMTLYPSTNSWWNGANVVGKARVFMAYPGGVGPYADKINDVAAQGYEGFTTSA